MGRRHQEDMMMEMGMGAGRHKGGRGGRLRRKEIIAAIAVVVGVYFAGKARALRSTFIIVLFLLSWGFRFLSYRNVCMVGVLFRCLDTTINTMILQTVVDNCYEYEQRN